MCLQLRPGVLVVVGFSGLAGCTLKGPTLENIWPPALRSQWGSRHPIGGPIRQKIVIACHIAILNLVSRYCALKIENIRKMDIFNEKC